MEQKKKKTTKRKKGLNFISSLNWFLFVLLSVIKCLRNEKKNESTEKGHTHAHESEHTGADIEVKRERESTTTTPTSNTRNTERERPHAMMVWVWLLSYGCKKEKPRIFVNFISIDALG